MTRNKSDNESSLGKELLDRNRFLRNKQDPAIQPWSVVDKIGRCNLRQMCAKEHLKCNFINCIIDQSGIDQESQNGRGWKGPLWVI